MPAVSARIGGRLDKLYVQFTGESVRRGQPVADLYRPEVATAIADYHLSQESRNQLRQAYDPNARGRQTHWLAQASTLGHQRKADQCPTPAAYLTLRSMLRHLGA